LIQKIDTIQLAINEHFAEPIEKGKGRQRRSIDLKALKGQKGKGNNNPTNVVQRIMFCSNWNYHLK
jgi:hypothetical protein